MSVKVEKTDNKNEIKMEFTVEAKVFEDGMKKVFTKNSKYFNIPGFRKGKAPMNVVEKYYGPEIFYEDAMMSPTWKFGLRPPAALLRIRNLIPSIIIKRMGKTTTSIG